jgi:hypothetical protein
MKDEIKVFPKSLLAGTMMRVNFHPDFYKKKCSTFVKIKSFQMRNDRAG